MIVGSEPTQEQPSAPAAPRVRQAAPDPYLDAPPPPVDNSRAIYTLAAAVGAATLLIVVGLIISSVGESSPEPAPMTTTLSEQHKMMREAVQVAKDANELQRERAELMRREAERGEKVSPPDGEKRAEGEFVGD